MLRGEPIVLYGDGSAERDYTWIDDIVRGVVAAVDRTKDVPGEFEVINLGGERRTSLRRLVDLLSGALGVRPRVEYQPPQPGDVRRTHADLAKARRLLGYQPTTPIEDGIERFARWLRTSGNPPG
jgi:UDP-glucuronate 4-epimerase